MKTLYDVLGVGPAATTDEIKQGFRRQIAQYHPDKVQHLGPELQEVAAERAAEITEAYRQLSNPELRVAYDRQSTTPLSPSPAPSAGPSGPNRDAADVAPPVEPPPTTPPPAVFGQDRASRDDFVRKASLERLREVAVAEMGNVEEIRGMGFDVAYYAREKRGLLKREPALMVCGRFVPRVDAEAVRAAWNRAVRLGRVSRDLCIFLVGNALAPRRELSGVIADLTRRLSRVSSTRIIVIPVDVHDWQGLVPADTPSPARRILDRLRAPA